MFRPSDPFEDRRKAPRRRMVWGVVAVLALGALALLMLSRQLDFFLHGTHGDGAGGSRSDDGGEAVDAALCACTSWDCLREGFAAREARRAAAAAAVAVSAAVAGPGVEGDGVVGRWYRVPHFYLGGGQKCGTTSMHAYLAQHPMIVPPSPKEPMHFNLPSWLRKVGCVRDQTAD